MLRDRGFKKREAKRTEEVPPLKLEKVRPCDLVICQVCGNVQYVGNLDLQKFSPSNGWANDEVEGIWCGTCDQLLYTRGSWIEHRVIQAMWDERHKAGTDREEGGRDTSPDPLTLAAVAGDQLDASADTPEGAADETEAEMMEREERENREQFEEMEREEQEERARAAQPARVRAKRRTSRRKKAA